MSKYFIDKESLRSALGGITPDIKMRSESEWGPPIGKTTEHQTTYNVTPSPLHVGRTEVFDRYSKNLKDGQQRLELGESAKKIKQGSLSVFRNGLCLVEGDDYTYNAFTSSVMLHQPIKNTEDDVEVRYEYFDGIKEEGVLLLAIGDFTMAQLRSLAPDLGDSFSIDKLIPNNPRLVAYTGGTGVVYKYQITVHGIVGDLQMSKYPPLPFQ